MAAPEGRRLRDFMIGGVVGAAAVVAAARRRAGRPEPKRRGLSGLAAFEDAPCFRETLEREAEAARSGR